MANKTLKERRRSCSVKKYKAEKKSVKKRER